MASDDERRGGGAGRTVGDALLVEQERRGAGAGLLQDAQERGVDTAEGVEQEDQDDGRVDAQLPRERSAAGDGVEQEDQGEGRVDAPMPSSRPPRTTSSRRTAWTGRCRRSAELYGGSRRSAAPTMSSTAATGSSTRTMSIKPSSSAGRSCSSTFRGSCSSAHRPSSWLHRQPRSRRLPELVPFPGVRSVLNTWVLDSFLSMIQRRTSARLSAETTATARPAPAMSRGSEAPWLRP